MDNPSDRAIAQPPTAPIRATARRWLQLLVSLFGGFEKLVAVDACLLDRWQSADGAHTIDAEINDFASMILRFTSGLVMQVQISWNAPVDDILKAAGFVRARRFINDNPMSPEPPAHKYLAISDIETDDLWRQV